MNLVINNSITRRDTQISTSSNIYYGDTSMSIYNKKPKKLRKICCLKCHSELSVNMFGRHYDTKQCRSGGKHSDSYSTDGVCKHCKSSYEELGVANSSSLIQNHVRWCKDNPKRNEYRTTSYRATSNGKQLQTPEAIEKRAKGISNAHKSGKYNKLYLNNSIRMRTFKHSDESKEKISKAASASTHQRVCKRTHVYTDKRGRVFKFDSSWEDTLADRLDNLDILWDRPEPIKYELDGKIKNYFPDFYLPEYDLYLDPKNPYAKEKQIEKLNIVSKMIKLVILETLLECKEFEITKYI